MASSGHEVMKDGGFGPFFDLTVPDPTYILPSVTALTLFCIMKIGVEFGAITAQTTVSPIQNLLKKGSMFAVPLVIFYATTKMPAAIGLYWATSNSISILQSLIMLNPKVRAALKIPPTIPKAKGEKRGIFNAVTQSWTDIKGAWKTTLQDRAARKISNEYLNQFERSGVGPLRKTYDYDPTRKNTKRKS
uniref:Mitochondrial inner membrane protein OXA1L n=2 Tax=Tetranychus urticae TaxID=32264 RepID=T1JV87_TETUR